MATFAVTDETFGHEVIESPTPVLVDFWAQNCGPCHMVAPVLEELSEEYEGRVRIAKLDTAANPKLTAAYAVMSIPTLNIYVGGELVKSIKGARPKRTLVKELDAVLATVSAESTGS